VDAAGPTVLGGLSRAGLVACLAVEGAADTAGRRRVTEHVLVPAPHPGQVVVMHNRSLHEAPRVRQLIQRAGCRLLFLPPDSPDFDPIEPAWSELTALLRGVGARMTAALHAALASLVDAITGVDARGCFRHCGYTAR
jgi:transposase